MSQAWLNVSGSVNYVPSSYTNNGVDGQMRFNTQTQNAEVYSNNTWTTVSNHASVDLTPRMTAILEWAEEQMLREKEFESLAKSNATVADALKAYKKAEEQLQIVTALVKTAQVD